MKIVDFYLMAYFWASKLFGLSVFRFYEKPIIVKIECLILCVSYCYTLDILINIKVKFLMYELKYTLCSNIKQLFYLR